MEGGAGVRRGWVRLTGRMWRMPGVRGERLGHGRVGWLANKPTTYCGGGCMRRGAGVTKPWAKQNRSQNGSLRGDGRRSPEA